MRLRRVVPVLCAVVLCAGGTGALERASAAVGHSAHAGGVDTAALPADDGALQPGGDSSQSTPFAVDVWTDKGGKGPGAYGGTFSSNDQVVVYIRSTWDCYASIVVRPEGGEPSALMDAQMVAGERYQIAPKETGDNFVGTWQVSVDAVSGTTYASDVVVFTVGDVALSGPLVVDVWTDKGGRGIGLPGGSYLLGENTTVWIEVGADCEVTLIIDGPRGSGSESVYLMAGAYSMQLGQAEAGDAGTWAITVEVKAAGQTVSDTVGFAVLPIESGAPAESIEPSGLQSRGQAPPRAPFTPDSATELDALIALKMAKGALPPDASMDVNGDGQVTVDDARLILLAAVE